MKNILTTYYQLLATTKTRTWVALGLVLILLPIVLLAVFRPSGSQAAWYDSLWSYRRVVSISNPSGVVQTDYQVLIKFDSSDMVSTGKMKNDCSDIRVTDSDGTTMLDFWLESGCNTNNTALWIEIPSLGTSGTEVFIYYGNSAATSASSIDNTFIPSSVWMGTGTCNDAFNCNPMDNHTKADYIRRVFPITSNSYVTSINDNTGGEFFFRRYRFLFKADTTGSHGIAVNTDEAGEAAIFPHDGYGNGYSQTLHPQGEHQVIATWYGSHSSGTCGTSGTPGNLNMTAGQGYWFDFLMNEWAFSQLAQMCIQEPSGSYQTVNTTNFADQLFARKYMLGAEPTASAGTEEAQLVGAREILFHFDEGYGTETRDSSINMLIGTISGASWQNDICVSGKCLYFDGDDDVVTVANDGNIDLNNDLSEAHTFEAWIRPNSAGEGSGGEIYQKGSSTYLRLSNVSNNVADLEASLDLDTVDATVTATAAITLNRWHHVAVVYEDDDDDEISIYVDGVLKATSTNGEGSPEIDSNDLQVGGHSSANFHGFIDDFTVWSSARSQVQIQSDYISGYGLLSTDNGLRLSDGLVGYWKMDESSWDGTSGEVVDYSGNGNHGTADCEGTCDIPTTSSGKFNRSGDFDSTMDYVEVGNPSTLQTTNGTVSIWVNPNSVGYKDGIISKANDGTWGSTNWVLTFDQSNNISFYYGQTNTNSVSTGVNTIVNNKWYHVTATWELVESSQTKVNIYLDGQLKQSRQSSNLIGTSSNVFIGSWGNSIAWDQRMNGKIDEARIYNRALTPQEVQALYKFAPSPVAHYTFDQGEGTTTLYDDSGYGNNATLHDVTENHWVFGKFGAAMNFDQADDTAQISDSESLDITSGITMAFWTKPKNLSVAADQYLLNKADSYFLAARRDFSSGIDWRLFIDGSFQSGPSVTLTDDTWQHVAATYDSHDRTMRIYINGILQGEEVLSSLSSYTIEPSNHALEIAGVGGNPSSDGVLDDIRIYNYARTPEQILQDMHADTAPTGQQVGQWKLDNNTHSSAGNAGSFTLVNSPTWTTGKVNMGLDFEKDSSQYGYIADSAELSITGSLTLGAWIKPESNTSSTLFNIAGKWDGSNESYLLAMYGDEVRMYIDSSSNYVTTTAANLQTGNWYHVAGSYNATAGTVTIYINGRPFATTTSGTIPNSIGDDGGRFHLASEDSSTTATNFFDGVIDDVQLFNTNLTQSEVQLLFNNNVALDFGTGADEAGQVIDGAGDPPVAYWKFDDNQGLTASSEYQVASMSGTISGAQWVPGKIGSALEFDGVDDYVKTTSTVNLSYTNVVTIEFWMKWYSYSDDNDIALEFSDNYNLNSTGFAIVPNSASDGGGKFTASIVGNAGYNNANFARPSANVWHHYAFVIDKGQTVNEIVPYVDGSAVAYSKVFSNNNTNNFGNHTLYLMSRAGSSLFGKGSIDDVKIFDYARTPAQIAFDYSRGAPVAHWKLDENSGTTVYDASGGGITGTVNGATWDTGELNSALSFDGTNDWVDLGNTGKTDVRSLSFWVKPSSTTEKILQLSAADYVEISNGTVTVTGFGTESIYINSRPAGGATVSADEWTHITIVSSSNVNANDVELGRIATDYYSGMIDDVRLYNFQLSEDQMKKIMMGDAAVSFQERN